MGSRHGQKGQKGMLRALQILSLGAVVASVISMALIGDSIAKDVNEAQGTKYNGIWNLKGNRVWQEHERLYPASRKRAALAAALVAAFGLLWVLAFLGQWAE